MSFYILYLARVDSKILLLLKILLGACLFVPLLALPSLVFPYTAPKGFVFRIIIEISAAVYFYLALKYPSNFFTPLLKRGVGGILSLSVLIFLFISFLSSIFGVDFYASFWGDIERMMGFWGLLHFAAFFLMLATVFRKNDWKRLLQISVGISSFLALLAIAQKYMSLGSLMPQDGRPYSLIGNAGFFASYLIFNIFFAVYLLFLSLRGAPTSVGATRPACHRLALAGRQSRGILPIVYTLLIVINCLALIFSGTRGAFLGLLAGGIIFLILYAVKYFSRSFFAGFKNWPFISLLIIIFLSIGLFLARSSPFVQNNATLNRLANISTVDVTAQNRLILWQKSWDAWQQKPIFGWGPENYQAAINRNFDSRLGQYNSLYDRAHNFIFDYGVSTGFFGLLAYLGLFAAALLALWKNRQKNLNFAIVFASLLVAYLAQNFFIFDSFISYLMLFFSLAMISGVVKNEEPAEDRKKTGLAGFGAAKKIILILVVAFTIFFVYSFNMKPWLADSLANDILNTSPQDAQKINESFQKFLSKEFFASPELVYQISFDYLEKINSFPALAQNEEFYNLAAARLRDSIENSPVRSENYIALGWLDLYFSGFDQKRIGEAITLAQKAKELSPGKKDAYLVLVAGYALLGQPAKAQEVVAQAKNMNEKLGQEVEDYWGKLK